MSITEGSYKSYTETWLLCSVSETYSSVSSMQICFPLTKSLTWVLYILKFYCVCNLFCHNALYNALQLGEIAHFEVIVNTV